MCEPYSQLARGDAAALNEYQQRMEAEAKSLSQAKSITPVTSSLDTGAASRGGGSGGGRSAESGYGGGDSGGRSGGGSVSASSAPSLLDIRRRDKAEMEATRDEAHLKRFKILNYTSEDSNLVDAEGKLKTYYCSICGSHALITNADLLSLPARTTDASIALQHCDFFHKKYMNRCDRIFLNRGNGVECQFRYSCKDCGFPLAYTSTDEEASCRFTYIYSDSLVAEQSRSAILREEAAV